MSSKLLNKAITSCFAKIARVDGSIGKEEIDIINSSKIHEFVFRIINAV